MSELRLALPFPPNCPFSDCPSRAPGAERARFRPHGRYFTDGRPKPRGVLRFRCLECERTCSEQTFSIDRHLQQPALHTQVINKLVSCESMRQMARTITLSRAAIARRLLRFGVHCAVLLELARRGLRRGGVFLLDEAETFEGSRLFGPLTVPVLVHQESRYTLAVRVATLAARVRPGTKRWERFKKRPWARESLGRRNDSNRVVRQCIRALLEVATPGSVLRTDLKPSYARILRQEDPGRSIAHQCTSSKARRGKRNPLWAINHTLAMVRDGTARMARRRWTHSKRAVRLLLHLSLYFAWKNFVRPRFNGDEKAPAQHVELTTRRWEPLDLVRWRIDLPIAAV